MNSTERMKAVEKFGYCVNCLAHSHSDGSCFTKTGCGYCRKRHHSLLHIHTRLLGSNKSNKLKQQSSAKEQKPSSSTSSLKTKQSSVTDTVPTTTSLTAILKQNAATLLPTALVKISSKDGKHSARCLFDTASKMSCISKQFVDKLGLTTLELDNEIICPITLWSYVGSNFQIETILRVNNRIGTITPKKSLPESILTNFNNLKLADKHFYKASTIDIILGVDVFSRVVRDGIFVRTGLPTAQNTSFGIILYGNFSI
ncbi:uncharacterized protein LOC142233648 [Haematobia irritans]|uniref:uncharacterized protein LOC142233648 n=1 Tax=Haematobia irritans TaxID=7368 RepID=UPI003F4F808F